MTSLFRQSRQLRGIERRLRRSEPHMAAMLTMFARLNAGAALVSPEQTGRRRHAAAVVLLVLAGAIGGLAAGARWVFGRTARLCAAARRRLSLPVRSPLGAPSAAPKSTNARRSPGF